MADEVKFEVGGTYENMKGAYEVISIQKDSMVIRWQDGFELVTSMDLQKRIIERMAYEKADEAKLNSKKSETPKKKKSAS